MTNFDPTNRYDGFEIFFELERRVNNAIPSALIRLGDGEGALMGFPSLTDRRAINRIFNVWFGSTEFSDEQVEGLAKQLHSAVLSADIVGIPRQRQMQRHPLFKVVVETIEQFDLISSDTLVTDAAIHRYFQFALFYRKLLSGKDFVGIISSRDVSEMLTRAFAIRHVEYFAIRGETRFPGEVSTPHYPSSFEHIKEHLRVPYQGALYLVGAGALGKIYCQWIKDRGGIAIDIGSIFDAWAQVKSRLTAPCHAFERYSEKPTITMREAISRYNRLINELSLDTAPISEARYADKSDLVW